MYSGSKLGTDDRTGCARPPGAVPRHFASPPGCSTLLAMHLHLQGAGSTSIATTGFLHAGLGDARAAQLLLALQQAAEGAAGEMALVQLAAAAQDAVDAANSPEGDCPICIIPLAGSGSGDGSSGGSGEAQKLPCFHCMHRWGCRHGNAEVPSFVC